MRELFALAGLTVGCVFGICVAPVSAAPPTVKEMLAYQPKQKGVAIAMPTAEEERSLKVKSLDGNKGYLLVDGSDTPLRKFYDARGGKRVDTWSYYKDGIEVYREIDTKGTNIADQFRWLNTAGAKWGVSTKGTGAIDHWLIISAEEVAEEVFQAVVENNPKRIEPLFINGDELKSLKLSADKADKIFKAVQGAPAKFAEAMKNVPSKAQFVRVENATPCLVPHEDLGAERDVNHFVSRAVLYQTGDGKDSKHDWLHTGSMVQVGMCWRLIDGPAMQMPESVLIVRHGPPPGEIGVGGKRSERLEKLLKGVSDLDAQSGNATQGMIKNPAAEKYNLSRAAIVEQIIQCPDLPAAEQPTWVKQYCDNLANAHIAGNAPALGRLTQYKDYLLKTAPKTLGAYASYRVIWATYAPQLQDPKNTPKMAKIQDAYNAELAKFVQTYPDAEDAPDALHQLGMGSEYAGRDEESKRWYKTLADNFPSHPFAPKAKGAVERLSLVGQELKLSGRLINSDNVFSVSSLKDKVVVVYYWASYCTTSVGDFAIMKRLQAAYGSKGLELVLVNLDDTKEQALQYLRANQITGVHLYEAPPQGASGMQSPLGLQYGIMGLPTMFLVGRDGKVVSRTLQASDLEAALKGAL